MKITTIIPVVNIELARPLLRQIDENSVPPDRVIIINNTKAPWREWCYSHFDINVYDSRTGLLNESLEVARSHLTPDCDLVTFFNDDLIINNWFFSRIVDAFRMDRQVGIVCPNTVKDPKDVVKGKPQYIYMKKREGWAFTIRNSILSGIPPIPCERLETFHGDDWIFVHTKNMGFNFKKDLGNTIYHYTGKSVLKLGFRSTKKSEYNEWVRMRKEIWGD